MFDELAVCLLLPSNTSKPPELTRLLETLESEPVATPTHASLNERKRLPYSREEAVSLATGKGGGALCLWRTSKPKYSDGSLTARNVTHNSLRIYYRPGMDLAGRGEVFAAWSRLVADIKPAFGFIHQVFVSVPEAKLYNPGYQMGFKELRNNGFQSFHARTWFGTDLVAVVGRERLLSLPLTRPTAWGGVELDLVDKPWESEIGPLFQRQTELKGLFKSWGLLGDYSAVGRPRPGSSWTPRTWGIY